MNYKNECLQIIPMTIDHITFYNEVRNECRQFLHNPQEFSLEDSIKWFKETSPEFYIVQSEEHNIGYFRTSIIQDKLFIGLDIHKDYRGKGLATGLYEQFFIFLKEKKQVSEVYLMVKKFNYRAINLYLKLGFVQSFEHSLCSDNDSFLFKKNI